MPGPSPLEVPTAELADTPLTASATADAVGGVLQRVLDERPRHCRAVDPVFARGLADRLAAPAVQGGGRPRTAFAHCGRRAAGGSGDATAVPRTGAALELLQACALVHDDLTDGSVHRRGAPALHVRIAREHRAAGMRGSAESFGTSVAVLTGDLALARADDLPAETALGTRHGPRPHRQCRAMRAERVAAQYRDLRAQAARSSCADEALTIATLKCALYTAARSLVLGASVAGADEHVLDALRAAGRCAGPAFPLRDDLLGAFGDPALTGKPADDDPRSRGRTRLLAVAVRLADATGDRRAGAALAPDAAPTCGKTVERVRAALDRAGARDLVEARIKELTDMSLAHIGRSGAGPAARHESAALVERATGPAPRAGEEAA